MHYEKLMERARNRELDGYTEKHHVIPKCMGGKNDKENIVVLTPEEHYLAHYLLVKMYPDNHRLLWAAMAMCGQTNRMERNNKIYGWLRRRFGETIGGKNRGRKASEESRRKMSESRRGKKRQPHTDETKRKMSEASKGKKKSTEHIASMSATRKGRTFGPHSEEWNEKIRQTNIETAKERDFSWLQEPEYRQSQAEHMREVWRLRKEGILPMPDHKK